MGSAIDPCGVDELLGVAKEKLPQEEDRKGISEKGRHDQGLVRLNHPILLKRI